MNSPCLNCPKLLFLLAALFLAGLQHVKAADVTSTLTGSGDWNDDTRLGFGPSFPTTATVA